MELIEMIVSGVALIHDGAENSVRRISFLVLYLISYMLYYMELLQIPYQLSWSLVKHLFGVVAAHNLSR